MFWGDFSWKILLFCYLTASRTGMKIKYFKILKGKCSMTKIFRVNLFLYYYTVVWYRNKIQINFWGKSKQRLYYETTALQWCVPTQQICSFSLEVAFLMELCPSGFFEPAFVISYLQRDNKWRLNIFWVLKCQWFWQICKHWKRYLEQLLIYD